ncbi:MAG TPA: STAS domain-containing protein [Actinophytocola sp.]|nr:STAS domain-containing protein [Actinophytocola sp.]
MDHNESIAVEVVAAQADVRLERHEPGLVLAVAGEIDLTTADRLRTIFDWAVQNARTVLVIDLSDVTFIGSMGLRLLLETHNQAKPRVVRIVAPHSVNRRAIEITSLDQVLWMFTDLTAALEAT